MNKSTKKQIEIEEFHYRTKLLILDTLLLPLIKEKQAAESRLNELMKLKSSKVKK